MDANTKDEAKVEKLSGIIEIDEGRIQSHLDEVVRGTVEETLNALLDAEADAICRAGRYVRSENRRSTRAGHSPQFADTGGGSESEDVQIALASL